MDFDNEIDTITGTFTNGDIVVVHDFDGYPMGRGFINQNSKIRIRMMTRKADQLIDDNFLRMRVQNAWDYRKQVMAGGNDNVPDLNCCRVIFGEADSCQGIRQWDNTQMCLWWSVWHLEWSSLR